MIFFVEKVCCQKRTWFLRLFYITFWILAWGSCDLRYLGANIYEMRAKDLLNAGGSWLLLAQGWFLDEFKVWCTPCIFLVCLFEGVHLFCQYLGFLSLSVSLLDVELRFKWILWLLTLRKNTQTMCFIMGKGGSLKNIWWCVKFSLRKGCFFNMDVSESKSLTYSCSGGARSDGRKKYFPFPWCHKVFQLWICNSLQNPCLISIWQKSVAFD